MSGYALLVLTALTQDSVELPLSRVYVSTPGGEVTLPELFAVRSIVGEATPERATFGRFRVDAMYLYPVAADALGLFADFAAHRRAFRIGQVGRSLPETIRPLIRRTPAGSLPSHEAIAKMLAREYPDLGQFLTGGP